MGGIYWRIPSFALVLVRSRTRGSRAPFLTGWHAWGWGRYPQNTASLAGTFSVQSRVKLPAGSLETSPPILRFLSDLTGDAPGSKFDSSFKGSNSRMAPTLPHDGSRTFHQKSIYLT